MAINIIFTSSNLIRWVNKFLSHCGAYRFGVVSLFPICPWFFLPFFFSVAVDAPPNDLGLVCSRKKGHSAALKKRSTKLFTTTMSVTMRMIAIPWGTTPGQESKYAALTVRPSSVLIRRVVPRHHRVLCPTFVCLLIRNLIFFLVRLPCFLWVWVSLLLMPEKAALVTLPPCHQTQLHRGDPATDFTLRKAYLILEQRISRRNGRPISPRSHFQVTRNNTYLLAQWIEREWLAL